jgi:glutamate 5-kinase
MYESLFGRRGITIGQVLLTWDDLRHKQRYLNLRNTLFKLLDCRALPIINENDSVGVDEIRFGDNDSLGAQIAMLVGADLYVILTDINGLYDANPTQRPDARHIPLVERVTPEIRRLATSRGNALGVGGMTTKLEAAAMVNRSGIATLVADGYHGRLMDALTSDTAGTLFLPAASRMPARRRWIAFAGKSQGALTVDDGARKALINQGRSLLPAGVKAVSGSFTVGSTIDIVDQQRRLFARGISNYSSAEAHRIAGLKSREIAEVLGEKSFDEIVHRDNMVLMNS